MFRPPQRLFVGHVRQSFPGDSETPNVEQSTSGAEPTVAAPVTPMLPQEIIDEILGYLAPDPDASCQSKFSLQYCSVVCKSWVESSRRHMFCKLYFDAERAWKWLQVFPVQEHSPGRHVRRVDINLEKSDPVLHKIIERFHGFQKLKTITVRGARNGCTLRMSQFVGLPKFVTSLRLMEDSITLSQIRDVISQLPNLDDLHLAGAIPVTDRNVVRGIGTTLTAKFGGCFQLIGVGPGCSDTDIVNMLLEVPTGLHFKDVHSWACLSSTVRIVEACSKTLVKLLYEFYNKIGHESLNRTFDFTEFPNLEGLAFVTPMYARDVHWLPEAISTLKPTTSPRLSSLRLVTRDRPPGSPVPSKERLGNVTRLVEEVTQVERKFKGAVKVTVPWYPEAEA